MTTKVFISYAIQDKQLAEKAKEELEVRGYLPTDTVFFDAHEVSIGEDIRERLKTEMEASASVVLVMSEMAGSSQWVNYEAGLADALGKKILIVGAKGAGKSQFLERLSEFQHVELEDAG